MSCFFVQTDNCVFLTCEGEVPLTEMAAIWREVQDVLAGMKKKRVWVDVTALQTSLDMKNLFDLAKLFWRDFPEGGRMALVVRWDQAGFAKSLEMMVRAVGMHLTAFVTKGRSEAWLEEDTGTQANSGSLNPAKPQLIHNS